MHSIMVWTTFSLFFSFLLKLLLRTNGYNIDITNPDILKGNPNSYFGYSLAIVDHTDKCILIGAPRDNDTQMPDINEPGRVHKCSIRTKNNDAKCQPLSIDNKTMNENVDIYGYNLYFKHGKNNQWLGLSIEVPTPDSGRGIVTCAPKWYNNQDSGWYMNGICYEIPNDFNVANIRKLPVLSIASIQVIAVNGVWKYDQGMAGMGMSIHYTKNDKDLFIGAPGLKDWTGGFVNIRENTISVMQFNVSMLPETASFYAGYAMTSGEFFSSGLTYLAIGVPRADLVGKVIFFNTESVKYEFSEADFELKGIDEGNKKLPMNSYFGGSLCSVDVNKDGIDDLLVGAPLYSNGIDDIIDQGKVLLYLGSNNIIKGFQNKIQELSGSKLAYSRFGTTIASLGDMNKDEYNDVAVGAPYEDDLRGAVYVYNGYRLGLWPKHSQKISASVFNTNLKGFGMSLASSKDINEDKINDLVIGSYLTDQAVVLYGNPVISMTAALKVIATASGTTINVIDKDQKDVAVQLCFEYEFKDCPSVSLNCTISLDTMKGASPRLVFQDNGLPVLEISSIKVFSYKCTDQHYITVKSTNDLVSPIVLQAKYESVGMQCSSSNSATLSRFNANNPGDPLLMVTNEMQFKKDCANNSCNTNLHLSVTLNYTGINQYYIIGTSDLTVNVQISKSNDPSYGSIFQMVYPLHLTYRKMEKIDGETDVSCNTQSKESNGDNETIFQQPPLMTYTDHESVIVCSFGNPMYNDSGVVFRIQMQVPTIVAKDSIELKMQASTLSRDTEWSDNNDTKVVYVKNYVEATFTGVSSPDTIFVDESTTAYAMGHVYEFVNKGPSSIPSATLVILNPHIQGIPQALLYMNSTEFRCGTKCEANCSISSHPGSPPVYIVVNGRHYPFQSNSNDVLMLDKLHNTVCPRELCTRLTCDIKNLQAQASAVVRLQIVAQKEYLDLSPVTEPFKILSTAVVIIDNATLFTSQYTFTGKISTTVIAEVVPKTSVPWWIWIVSAISGILLIALIMLIFYKVGFFKRKKRDQLLKQMEEDTQTGKNGNVHTYTNTNNEDGTLTDAHKPAK